MAYFKVLSTSQLLASLLMKLGFEFSSWVLFCSTVTT